MADDHIKILLNMRDGRSEIDQDLSLIEDLNVDDYSEQDNFDDKDLRQSSNEKIKSKRKKLKLSTNLPQNDSLSFEEQKEIEGPIEIDLRNVYRTYGINPIDTRQKSLKRQSKNIINSSIGEAYMKFVYNKEEEAINLLFEIIRMNPLDPEPYEALGDIYLKMGNYNKALEFYLLEIEFNPTDSKKWADLADIASLNRMYKSALQFYSKAIKLSPRNTTYYIKKSNLLEQLRQFDDALKILEKILSFIDPEEYQIKFAILFRIADIYNTHLNNSKEALIVVEELIKECSLKNSIKSDSIKFYLPNYFDILLANHRTNDVIRYFIEFKLINLDFDDENLLDSESHQLKETTIELILSNLGEENFFKCDLVLKSKLICAFIYLNKIDRIVLFLNEFESIDDDVSVQESIYRSLIPALMELARYDEAHKFVTKLLRNSQTSKYWFWCGFCLRQMFKDEKAIEAFERSIQMDSNNYDAVNALSDLCNEIGMPERALGNVNVDHLKNDVHLLVNRCNLLFICKRWSEFIVNSEILLGSDVYFFENLTEINEMIYRSLTSTSLLRSAKGLRRSYSKRNNLTKLYGGQLTLEQFFSLWKKAIFVLLNYLKEEDRAVRWAFSGLLSSFNSQLIQPILLIIFRTCLEAKYRSFTFDLAKVLIKENLNSGQMWYAFSAMMNNIYQDFRHKRFCIRLWAEHPENVHILLMNGHIAFLNSRYIHALGIYLMIYRMRTAYRYDSFHVASMYMHLIYQNNTVDKCSLFAQMVAFLYDYVQKVGKCQETYYNVGRAFHQLGFVRYALELYRSALKTPLKIHDKRFDLSPEIAYNMAQILKNSGQQLQANELILNYCTI